MNDVAESIRRATIVRHGLTVTDLAERLAIGRPALSNVLNGNASLSIELALRLEGAFGLDARKLLVRQLDNEIRAAREILAADKAA